MCFVSATKEVDASHTMRECRAYRGAQPKADQLQSRSTSRAEWDIAMTMDRSHNTELVLDGPCKWPNRGSNLGLRRGKRFSTLPDEFTVTQPELTTATEATMCSRYGQVVHDLSGTLATPHVSGCKVHRCRLSTSC